MKVRLVDEVEQKSTAEVETQLLKEHEESLTETPKEEVSEEVSEPVVEKEPLGETELLSIISERLGRDINSLDDLKEAREESGEMDSEVAAFFKYKKETGRGVKDFVQLNKDYDTMKPDNLIKEYLTATEEGLDEDDINAMMEDYNFDEDLDDEGAIRKIRLAKRKLLLKRRDTSKRLKKNTVFPLSQVGHLL